MSDREYGKGRSEVLSFRLEPDVLAELRNLADAQGCTISDLLRRGVLMALEEPARLVITWTSGPAVTMLGNTQTVAVNAATADASAPTTPGEGPRTGTGGPDAPGASEGLDAAIEAALHAALYEAYIEITYVPDWETYEGNCRVCDNYCADGDKADITADASEHIAVVHVRSAKDAEPILRQAVAEDIARRIEVLEDYEAAEIAREVGRGQ